MAKRAGFVAGGTGITPIISIIRWILTSKITAELFLIFANKAESDVIFRREWECNVQNYPNFHCHHVLEQPPPGWEGGIGRVTPEILRHHLPAPGSDTCVFLCGPPPMVDSKNSAIPMKPLFSTKELPSSHLRRYPITLNLTVAFKSENTRIQPNSTKNRRLQPNGC